MPTRLQERYLNVIHILRYEINTLQQLSASTCFRTIVGLCIQSRSSVNRDKRNGYRSEETLKRMKRIGQNYVTIKQRAE